MDEWNLPDVIGAAGGVIGVAVAIVMGVKSLNVAKGSLDVAKGSRDEAKRAADAGEVSAQAASDAARAGERSAEAAQASADEAATVNKIEREREHDRLGPGPVPTIVTTLEDSARGKSLPRNLFGTMTVPRDYRVVAEAVMRGGARTPLGLDRLVHAGRTYRFHIEHWPPGRTEPEVDHIAFRFWVPTETDQVEGWTCPCDRPMVEGADRGHWEWRAPISFKPPRTGIASF